MSKHEFSWQAIEITDRARTMAEEAAARHGVTLGEWVSAALVAVAERSANGSAPGMERRLEAIERQCGRLLEVAERAAGGEARSEQRLTSLASAMNELAKKVVAARTASSVGPADLSRSLDPVRTSIDTLNGQIDALIVAAFGGAPPVTAHAVDPRFTGRPAVEPPVDVPLAEPEPAAPVPQFDFDKLNQHALDNTQRSEEDKAAGKGGLMKRVLGGG
jgi:hypothetical protein